MTELFSNAYDEVSYPGFPFSRTHPDRLATIATLFGMKPAPVENCRVLELGCGDGGNLLPMAFGLRGSEFAGIDLAGLPIARGRAMAEALGLKNVSLRQEDILQFSACRGQYDYIIAHGIYSWVPTVVQDKLLQICHNNRLLTESPTSATTLFLAGISGTWCAR
jgi:cyclopropane fatty-acyl-phospholipid synthase-like methyltransferase